MNYKHGLSHSRIDSVYKTMIARCYNPSSKSYPNYGGRGIKVCDEWRNDKTKFFKWALETGYDSTLPRGKQTIERIDVNGDYSPQNCTWADYYQQANNRRSNRRITYNGETHTIKEWERLKGFHDGTLWNRLFVLGFSVEKALTQEAFAGANGFSSKTQKATSVEYNGETHTYSEWGKLYGIDGAVIRDRVRYGWDIERAITTPQIYTKKRKAVTHDTT